MGTMRQMAGSVRRPATLVCLAAGLAVALLVGPVGLGDGAGRGSAAEAPDAGGLRLMPLGSRLRGPDWVRPDPGEGDGADGGPLTLEAAVEEADRHNPDIRIAHWEAESAETMLDSVEEYVDQIPQGRINVYELGPASGAAVDPARVMFAASDTYLALRQAQAGRTIAVAAREHARRSVRLAVTEGYYGLLKVRALADVARRAVDRAREQLESARAMLDAGVVAAKDVLDAEVGLSAARAQLATAEAAEAGARMAFNNVLGRPVGGAVDLSQAQEFDSTPLPDLEAACAGARVNRFEVIRAAEGLAVADYDLELAGRFRPPGDVMLQVTYRQRQARLRLEKAEAQAELEVRRARLQFQEAAERVVLYEKSVALAAESLRLARLRYENGLATSLEVDGAQVSLRQAEALLVEAICDHDLARARFMFAAGLTGPTEEGDAGVST